MSVNPTTSVSRTRLAGETISMLAQMRIGKSIDSAPGVICHPLGESQVMAIKPREGLSSNSLPQIRYANVCWLCSSLVGIVVAIGCGGVSVGDLGGSNGTQTTRAALGKAIFFDTSLSTPKGMSCGTCHAANKGFADPRPGSTSEGVIAGRFGNRNAPSVQYMAFSPKFDPNGGTNGGAIGGQFWDGRAASLEDQVQGPMLNPLEMNNPSIDAVVAKLKVGPEAKAIKKLYGDTVFDDPAQAFAAMQDAIATFERTPEVSPFTSKFDAYLRGTAHLSDAEARGLALFNGKALCSTCHSSTPLPDGTPPLFTNFTYSNLGLPKNAYNPYYKNPSQFNPLGSNYVDYGLYNTTTRETDKGLFMVPTLRNISVTAPYFHNGIFQSLGEAILFYNTSQLGQVFGPAEVQQNVDTTVMGKLSLSSDEVQDLTTFLQTLTDGYVPKP